MSYEGKRESLNHHQNDRERSVYYKQGYRNRSNIIGKVLITKGYTWQNFPLRLPCIVNRLPSYSQEAKV